MIDNILGTYKTLEDMLNLKTEQDKDILESMDFERAWIRTIKDRYQPQPNPTILTSSIHVHVLLNDLKKK